MSDDVELVQRIRAGAADDYAELVRRHQTRVFSILYRYERDLQRVEDLAQETFIKAWRALAQFDGRAPFEHWISRIAVRTALDHLRREKKHRKNDVAIEDLGEDAMRTKARWRRRARRKFCSSRCGNCRRWTGR